MEDEDSALLSAGALDETSCLPADLGASGYVNVPTETQGVGHKRSGSMLSAQFNFNQPVNRFNALGRIQAGVEGSEKLG